MCVGAGKSPSSAVLSDAIYTVVSLSAHLSCLTQLQYPVDRVHYLFLQYHMLIGRITNAHFYQCLQHFLYLFVVLSANPVGVSLQKLGNFSNNVHILQRKESGMTRLLKLMILPCSCLAALGGSLAYSCAVRRTSVQSPPGLAWCCYLLARKEICQLAPQWQQK